MQSCSLWKLRLYQCHLLLISRDLIIVGTSLTNSILRVLYIRQSSRLIHIDKKDANGRTALSVAASEGQLEAVRFLLESGADLNVTDRMENTALYDAVRHHHKDVGECRNWPGIRDGCLDKLCFQFDNKKVGDGTCTPRN